jgi:acyl-CoA thioesterase
MAFAPQDTAVRMCASSFALTIFVPKKKAHSHSWPHDEQLGCSNVFLGSLVVTQCLIAEYVTVQNRSTCTSLSSKVPQPI